MFLTSWGETQTIVQQNKTQTTPDSVFAGQGETQVEASREGRLRPWSESGVFWTRGLSRIVMGERWTGSPNKRIDQIGKNCPKIVFPAPPDNFWTLFGQFFDTIRTFFRCSLSLGCPTICPLQLKKITKIWRKLRRFRARESRSSLSCLQVSFAAAKCLGFFRVAFLKNEVGVKYFYWVTNFSVNGGIVL